MCSVVEKARSRFEPDDLLTAAIAQRNPSVSFDRGGAVSSLSGCSPQALFTGNFQRMMYLLGCSRGWMDALSAKDDGTT